MEPGKHDHSRPWNNWADVDQSQPENQNICRYSNEIESFLRFNYVNKKDLYVLLQSKLY